MGTSPTNPTIKQGKIAEKQTQVTHRMQEAAQKAGHLATRLTTKAVHSAQETAQKAVHRAKEAVSSTRHRGDEIARKAGINKEGT